jgi:serine protease AprX
MRKFHVLVIFAFCSLFSFGQQATTTKNGVTLGPGVTKKLSEKDHSMVMILTYHSPAEAAEARKLLTQKGMKFVGPEFKELPIQGVKAAISDLDRLTKIKGAWGIWENQKLNGDMHQAVIVSRVKNVREDAAFTALNGGLPLTGRGVGVLVNDSGFDGDSTDIQEESLLLGLAELYKTRKAHLLTGRKIMLRITM